MLTAKQQHKTMPQYSEKFFDDHGPHFDEYDRHICNVDGIYPGCKLGGFNIIV